MDLNIVNRQGVMLMLERCLLRSGHTGRRHDVDAEVNTAGRTCFAEINTVGGHTMLTLAREGGRELTM